MKHIFLLLLCLSSLSANSQIWKVDYSEVFDQPDQIATKTIQCPNGNTLFFMFGDRGFEVSVYDNAHKLIAKDVNNLNGITSSANMRLSGMFVSGNNVMLFLQFRDEEPTLYRLEVSPENGKILKQERVAKLSASNRSSSRAEKYAKLVDAYCIKRDKLSGAYAIVYYQTQVMEGAAKIELMLFNASNQEIGRTIIKSPKAIYTTSAFRDVIVHDSTAFLCTFVYSDGRGGTQLASELMLTRFKDGKANQVLMAHANNENHSDAVIGYNNANNTVVVLASAPINTKNTYTLWSYSGTETIFSSTLFAINPDSLSIKYQKPVDNRPITAYRSRYYQMKEDYSGFPRDMIINSDGTITVISEELNSSKSGLHDLGVVEYDIEGNAKGGYAVRHGILGANPMNFLSDMRQGRVVSAHTTNVHDIHPEAVSGHNISKVASIGFNTYEYFQQASGKYLLFNDHEKNFTEKGTEDPIFTISMNSADAAAMKLSEGGLQRYYLFGSPSDAFDNRIADFASGDYNEQTGIYTVIIIEKKGRKQNARIGWASMK